MQDKIFHRTKSTDNNSNRRQYTFTLMKENKRNKNKNIQQNRARSELLAGVDTNNNISKLSDGSGNLINYADFHIR